MVLLDQMTKVLIFDFDGTIADSMALASDIANDVLPAYGWPDGVSPSDIKKLRNMNVPQALRYLRIPAYRLPKLAIVAKQAFTKRIEHLMPIDGMVEVLRQLSEQGVEMGIVTSNSNKNVMTFLRRNNLKQYFSFVEAGASVLGKSRNIKHAIKSQRIDPKDCYYIGDEIRDIEASRAIKIDCISVTWGINTRASLEKLKPRIIIDKPSQLLKIVAAD